MTRRKQRQARRNARDAWAIFHRLRGFIYRSPKRLGPGPAAHNLALERYSRSDVVRRMLRHRLDWRAARS